MNDQLTTDDLRAYQAGALTGAARHRVERLLLENPFYADALDGLNALHAQSGRAFGAAFGTQTAELRQALAVRIRKSATHRRLMRLWITTAVAAILLMLTVATYLIFNRDKLPKPRSRAVTPVHIPGGKQWHPRPSSQ
jgi:anti-sigma factor RsiW